MFYNFDNVAQSLNVLAQSDRFRRVIDIHNDIIKTIKRSQQLENNGILNGDLHDAFSNEIVALNLELTHANNFDNQLKASNTTMVPTN